MQLHNTPNVKRLLEGNITPSSAMYQNQSPTAPFPGYHVGWPTTYPNMQPQWTQWQNFWFNCPHCNKLIVQVGYIFCPNCGTKIAEQVDTEDKQDKILRKLDEIMEILKDPHTE